MQTSIAAILHCNSSNTVLGMLTFVKFRIYYMF